ncbi:hypothetical protein [Candidatus Poriferisodalis sp.]
MPYNSADAREAAHTARDVDEVGGGLDVPPRPAPRSARLDGDGTPPFR